MEEAVYLLCAITAAACGALLLRTYARRQFPLLLWCGLFFLTLTIENLILFADLVLFPQLDLSLPRNVIALLGVTMLLHGLISDTR